MNNATTSLENFFSECYLQYKDIIQNYIAYRIPHSNEAEDLVQDVFVRLWDHKDFLNRETVRSLLFTIARNIVIDRIRRYYVKENFISIYNNVWERSRNTTEETVLSRELQLLHRDVVNRLPSKRKQIYQMSFDNEMSCPEIAERLSLSVRTVEGQMFLARKIIRASLAVDSYHVG